MERFLRAGYAVPSWDKPGASDSMGEFFDGAYVISNRVGIMVQAVAMLQGHPDIDPQRIGV